MIEAIRVVLNLEARGGAQAELASAGGVRHRRLLAAVLNAASADIAARTRAESVTVLAQETAAQRSSARTLAAVSGELQVLLPTRASGP
jgi:valyl-tRNA synthetase